MPYFPARKKMRCGKSKLPTIGSLLLTLIVVALSGCGRGDRLSTYPATGQVSYPDGRPLEGGTIIFESVEQTVTARGAIDIDGGFELGTYESGDGAVAGRHRVAISPPSQMDVDPDEGEVPALVHPRFTHPETSELEFTVSADGPNRFEVEVERP